MLTTQSTWKSPFSCYFLVRSSTSATLLKIGVVWNVQVRWSLCLRILVCRTGRRCVRWAIIKVPLVSTLVRSAIYALTSSIHLTYCLWFTVAYVYLITASGFFCKEQQKYQVINVIMWGIVSHINNFNQLLLHVLSFVSVWQSSVFAVYYISSICTQYEWSFTPNL